jgi:hypothetical protein
MRVHILALAALSAAFAAEAASIDDIKTGRANPTSIQTITCKTCQQQPRKAVAQAPELEPGTQKVELREVGGVMKVYRTEAWLGGSPIVFVSKATPDLISAMATTTPAGHDILSSGAAPGEVPATPPATLDANLIDEGAKTSAVTADIGAEAKVETRRAAFDVGTLELRLN